MRIILFMVITCFVAGDAMAISARKEAIERQKDRDREELQREVDKVSYLKKISESQAIYAEVMLKIIQKQHEQNRIMEQVLAELKELNSKDITGR